MNAELFTSTEVISVLLLGWVLGVVCALIFIEKIESNPYIEE